MTDVTVPLPRTPRAPLQLLGAGAGKASQSRPGTAGTVTYSQRRREKAAEAHGEVHRAQERLAREHMERFGEERGLQWLAARTRDMLRPRRGIERKEVEVQPVGGHACKASTPPCARCAAF